MSYYNGYKLLQQTDTDGKTPMFYMVNSNRTAGKTTFFNRYVYDMFLKTGRKFILLYRYQQQLSQVDDKFFKDIRGLFFQNMEMKSKADTKNGFAELFTKDMQFDDWTPCGYALAINGAAKIKSMSHLFTDADTIIFDEYVAEDNVYCPDEINKFLSILISIARGNGKQFRPITVIMISNRLSMLNPYNVSMRISEKLQNNQKFLRGKGFVMEFAYNAEAEKAIKESPIAKAFPDSRYIQSSTDNTTYLLDNTSFIDTPTGNSNYLLTINYNGDNFAIREYPHNLCVNVIRSNLPADIILNAGYHG